LSMYNSLFRVEDTAGAALSALGVDYTTVPRFRDAYFAWMDDKMSEPIIVLLTRTGGGNRLYYENQVEHDTYFPEQVYTGPFNDDLRKLTGFISDCDDSFDKTYAYFKYEVPDEYTEKIKQILEIHGEPMTLKEKFDIAVAAIENVSP